jgi:hypothetical protein
MKTPSARPGRPAGRVAASLADDIEAGHIRRAAHHAALFPPPCPHRPYRLEAYARRNELAPRIVSDLLRNVGAEEWRDGYLLGNEAEAL